MKFGAATRAGSRESRLSVRLFEIYRLANPQNERINYAENVAENNMTTDLERILGYRDAIDSSQSISRVAEEMYALSCWTPGFCSALIQAAELTGTFEPDLNDPVPGREVSLAMISPKLFNAVEADFGARVWPQLQENWPLIDYHGLQDVFVIKYEVGQQEELRMHHDVAQVSASIKLNDDYEGAELEFPRQRFSNRDLKIGQMLAWPSLVTHPHQSAKITKGVKYSATVWFELPIVNQA